MSTLVSLALKPFIPIGRYAFDAMLSKIQTGCVNVHTPTSNQDDSPRVYGNPSDTNLRVNVTVHNQDFYARLVLRADLGFAEAYMLGDIDVDNLTAFITVYIRNRDAMGGVGVPTASVGTFMSYLAHTRLANTLANSLSNISAHYDLGNELFTAFLDPSMMYSSAVWKLEEESLTDAQYRKMNMLMDKARLTAGDDVLEIGTGWGTFAIHMAKERGCRVTSVTLSKEQKQYAEDQIALQSPDVRARIQILLLDYRLLPEHFPNRRFDKIVSIEMIEAVGPEFLSTFFTTCDQMLNAHTGVMAFQCITMPESRYESYCKSADFIQRYIFPGGHCPSVTALIAAIHQGSKGQMMVDHVENIGPHYARTLRIWRAQFLAAFPKLSKFPKEVKSEWMGEKEPFYSQVFKRKWEYYFSYCEAGFATRTLGNVQMTLTREANAALMVGQESIVL